MRRRPFLATSVAASLSFLGGCLAGSSPLDDWGFEDREAEAWSYYQANVDVLEAPDEQTDERIETAIDELSEANEIYATLTDEADERVLDDGDHVFWEVKQYLLAMGGLVASLRDGLVAFMGSDPAIADIDPALFFRDAEEYYSDARETYNDLDELQDAIDGDRFE